MVWLHTEMDIEQDVLRGVLHPEAGMNVKKKVVMFASAIPTAKILAHMQLRWCRT